MNDDVVQEILNAIKDNMKELKDGQKEIQRDIGEIKITQAEQHITLVDHTKRSTANEEEIKLAKIEFGKRFDQVDEEFKPIWRHINYVKGGFALLGVLLTVVSILAFFHKL